MQQTFIMVIKCPQWDKNYSRRSDLNKHIRNKHYGEQVYHTCHICRESFEEESLLNGHFADVHSRTTSYVLRKTALDGKWIWYLFLFSYENHFLPLLRWYQSANKTVTSLTGSWSFVIIHWVWKYCRINWSHPSGEYFFYHK